MALDLATLIDEIEAAYQDAEDNPGAGNRPLATAVATAIDKFTKTAKVSVPAVGIVDSTTNPCTGQSDTGSLS